MAGRIGFELVSPEKLLLSEDVEMVVVPGGEGNFGVLPGHALFDRAQIEETRKTAEAEIASLTERLSRLQGPERDRAAVDLAAAEARHAVAEAKRAALETGSPH